MEGTAPEISVVIASFSSGDRLRACLGSILPQAKGQEIIVARGAAPEEAAELQCEFPDVTFVAAEPGTSVFQLRAMGVGKARGRVVALVEDHCVVSPGWLAALTKAFQGDRAVVGGTVTNGARGVYGWALFCCEYLAFMPPLPSGPADTLSGVNVAYRREAIERVRGVWACEFRENEVHDALKARGQTLYREGAAEVRSNLDMRLLGAMAHLYGGGRHFAAYRQRGARTLKRLGWALLMPVVPAVLLGRILRQVWKRGPQHVVRTLPALPFVMALVGAWSAGEGVGYMRALASGVDVPSAEAAR